MKNILIINCHPNKDSFNFGIADAYKYGVLQNGNQVKEVDISSLKFNPNLQFGYQKRTDLESDLLDAWDKILWANHLVWICPVWWGGLPAIAKGFIDRLFLPGFAFQYRENSWKWDKLLAGKSGHIITTMDQPTWYYWFVYGKPSINQLKKSVLEFCGVKPVKVTYLGPVKNSDTNMRNKWLDKITELSQKLN